MKSIGDIYALPANEQHDNLFIKTVGAPVEVFRVLKFRGAVLNDDIELEKQGKLVEDHDWTLPNQIQSLWFNNTVSFHLKRFSKW